MYISNYFLEEYLGRLDGDSVRILLYQMFYRTGVDSTDMATFLNLDAIIVQESIEKLVELKLWDNAIIEYQAELGKKIPVLMQQNNHFLGPNAKNWLMLKKEQEIRMIIEKVLPEINFLLYSLSVKWQCSLTAEMIIFIIYCIEYLELSIEMVEYLLLQNTEHSDIHALEKHAEMWVNLELTNMEMIKNYEDNKITYLSAILEVFQEARFFTFNELARIVGWMVRDKYSVELVVYACLITKAQINKMVIPYVEKILDNWKGQGITTVGELLASKILRSIPEKRQLLLEKQVYSILAKRKLREIEK